METALRTIPQTEGVHPFQTRQEIRAVMYNPLQQDFRIRLRPKNGAFGGELLL